MARPDLHNLSVTEIATGVRAGKLSPVEIVEACLERISRHDPRLRAWVFVDRDGALEQAKALDVEARAGRIRGPLHGVPAALKDIFDAAGLVTTSGAGSFAHRRAERDAHSVGLLRQAGAVILGKTVTTPFAFADPSPTRNPWNVDHTPGGSSSGSAAAVAARMVPLALGSQTIGSTVRPAAFCGIVGLKGTWGRINTEGVTPLSWTLDHVGILTRTVEDAALAFSVLAEPRDPERAAPAGPPAPPRLGIPRTLVEAHASAEVAAHLESAASLFRRRGAVVTDVALPESARRMDTMLGTILRSEAAAYHRRWFPQHGADYPARIRELVEAGLTTTAVDYLTANEQRYQFRREMYAPFERCDVLLLPPSLTPAPPLSEGTTGSPLLCAPWSFGGFPAMGLPSGLSRSGLPLGIQLVAPMVAEQRLFEAARWCEAVLEFDGAPAVKPAPPASRSNL